VAELIRAKNAGELPNQMRYYTVGEFPLATERPLEVVPFYLAAGGLTAVFRECEWDREPDFRYPIMNKRKIKGRDFWVTRGIISGPKGDAYERIHSEIDRICQQPWGQ
jgi:hypothetical protein